MTIDSTTIIVVTKYASIATTAFFTALGLLKDFRKDGRVTSAGRIAILGAVISAALAFATESVSTHRDAENTKQRLNYQSRLLEGQEQTLEQINRTMYSFDSVNISLTLAFPAEYLQELKEQWDDFVERVPKQQKHEISDWWAPDRQTLFERVSRDLTVCPGSRLYPDRHSWPGTLLEDPFELVLSRPDLQLESRKTLPDLRLLRRDDVLKIADLYFYLLPSPPKAGSKEHCIKYNRERDRFDFTLTFQNVAPEVDSGRLMSVLDLPNSTLLLRTPYGKDQLGISMTQLELGFVGSASLNGGRTARFLSGDISPVDIAGRLGVRHTFTPADFDVTRGSVTSR